MTAMRYFIPRAALIAAVIVLVLPLGGNTACVPGGNTRDPDAPPDPGEIYQEGLDLKAQGEESGSVAWDKVYEKFAEACEVGFREDVNSPLVKACFNAGVVADKLGRPGAATGHYKRALEVDPGFKPAVQNLTVSLLTDGKATDALPIYEEYLAKNPGDVDMINNYAGALAEAGQYDKGVEAIQGLLFKDPKNTRAYKTLARVYFLAGMYRMSQMASANALKLDPDDADIHNNIGLTFLKEGKDAEAVVAFKEALKLDEDNLEANMNLGLLAVDAADYQTAAQSFQKVLVQFQGNADARIGMAVAYRGSLEFDSAIEQYDQILVNDKCHELALLNKALVQFLFQDEYKKALGTYGDYSRCHPDEDISELTAKVQYEIDEEVRVAAELAELERQLAELEQKAKEKKVVLEKEIQRGIKVFEKYAEVEQDPSWVEVFVMQVEGTQFAIESEDFFFMEEAHQYLEEFMVTYYTDALELDPEEWTSRGEIVIEVPVEEGAEGEAAEGAEVDPATESEAAPEIEAAPEGEAAPEIETEAAPEIAPEAAPEPETETETEDVPADEPAPDEGTEPATEGQE